MQTVTIDKSGKVYLPKEIREKVQTNEYHVVVLPDGTMVFHQVKKYKTPEEALRAFQKLHKTTKPLKQIKKEIEEQAMREVS